jgi:hypothetical protein
MDAVVVIVLLVLVAAMWVSAISALVSAARLPDLAWRAARRSKTGTILGIIVTGGVGGLYYWMSIHRVVADGRTRTPPPPKSDPWSDEGW